MCADCGWQLTSFTEVIWFVSRTSPEDRALEIVQPTDVVRDLGVLLGSELTMKKTHQQDSRRLLLPSSTVITAVQTSF